MGQRKTLLERHEKVTGLYRDDEGVWRDQYDRPALLRADGKGRAPYLRFSKIGEEFEDRRLLEDWGKRKVAEGVAMNEHLITAVRAHRRKRNKMNELCEEALQLAKAYERREMGTAEHHFFDDLDLDRPTDRPEYLDDDAEAYEALTRPRLRHLHVEQFCACDTWIGSLPVFLAGRPDRISQLKVDLPFPEELQADAGMEYMPAGATVVVDNKTGRWVKYSQLVWGLQCAAAANAVPYDVHADERFDWKIAPRTDWALIVHAPYREGEARLYWLNIDKAWRQLVIAIARRDANAEKASLMAPVPRTHIVRGPNPRRDW
jgi:hypothetical protein